MALIKVITPSVTDANITTAKVTDNAITLAKMASGTDGNIISYDASGNPVAIATGSDGQVLTSTGAGSPPAFEAAAAGGKVLQVITATTTTQVSTTSASYVDSGLSAAITPSATSSKILVLVSMDIICSRGSAGYFRAQIQLLRGSTQLLYNHFGGYSNVGTDNAEYGTNNRTYLDSPSSTSAVTYKTQVQVNSGATLKLQEGGASSRPSTITLMEIGA